MNWVEGKQNLGSSDGIGQKESCALIWEALIDALGHLRALCSGTSLPEFCHTVIRRFSNILSGTALHLEGINMEEVQ